MEISEEWSEQLSNYSPFRIPEDEAAATEPLFRLAMSDEDLQEEGCTHVFTDVSEDDMPRIEVYRAGSDWLFAVAPQKEASVCCRMRATEDFRQVRFSVENGDFRFAVNNAAMLTYAFASAASGTLEMHAAVVVRNGLGYLFLGKSGTGKSTHARLWQEAFPESWLLNDDNPILRIADEQQADGTSRRVVRVYGSPWSGKTPCYKNQSAPVGGIVKLTQAPRNEARRLRLPEAYAYMLSSASGLKIDPTMMDTLYKTIVEMIETVPLYGLECLPDTDAARVCASAVTPQS